MGIFKLKSSEILLPFPVLTPRGLHPALIEAIISRGESPIEKQDFREKFRFHILQNYYNSLFYKILFDHLLI